MSASGQGQVAKMRLLDEMDARGECYCRGRPDYLCPRHAARFRAEYAAAVAANLPFRPLEALERIIAEG